MSAVLVNTLFSQPRTNVHAGRSSSGREHGSRGKQKAHRYERALFATSTAPNVPFFFFYDEYIFLSLSKMMINLPRRERSQRGGNVRIVFLFFGKKEIIMIKKRKETSFIHGWNEVVGAITPRIFSSSMIYRNSRKLAKRQASGVSGIRGLSPTPNTLSRKNG